MISEASCDTKDWSNGFWKVSIAIKGINYILKYSSFKLQYFRICKKKNLQTPKRPKHNMCTMQLCNNKNLIDIHTKNNNYTSTTMHDIVMFIIATHKFCHLPL